MKTPNEMIVSLARRVDALERRRPGGGGIYVGPDYRGCGDTVIQVPATPNPITPPAIVEHPQPIPDLVIWVRLGGQYRRYDPLTGQLGDQSPYTPAPAPLAGRHAIDGWIGRGQHIVNLRTGEIRTPVWPTTNENEDTGRLRWRDRDHLYFHKTVYSLAGDRFVPVIHNEYTQDDQYPKYALSDRLVLGLVECGYGRTDNQVSTTGFSRDRAYGFYSDFLISPINREGNILAKRGTTSPDFPAVSHLLSGYDMRLLGTYQGYLLSVGGLLYYDSRSSGLLTNDFRFLQYIPPSICDPQSPHLDNPFIPYSPFTFASNSTAAAIDANRNITLIDVATGLIIRAMPYSDVVLDWTFPLPDGC